MKKFLAIFGAGIVVGLMAAPASGRQLRGRLGRRLRAAFRQKPWNLRYLWREAESRLAFRGAREEGMDKTLADSFPASDPPSSIPNPEEDSIVA